MEELKLEKTGVNVTDIDTSDSRIHLLAKLAEECGEVIQAVGKCLRFGLYDVHPAKGEANIEQLKREIIDVKAAISFLYDECQIGDPFDGHKILDAKRKIRHYLNYAINKDTTCQTTRCVIKMDSMQASE